MAGLHGKGRRGEGKGGEGREQGVRGDKFHSTVV